MKDPSNERGTMTLLIAILLPVGLGLLGLLVDLGFAYGEHQRMQLAVDAAALAQGSVMFSHGIEAPLKMRIKH